MPGNVGALTAAIRRLERTGQINPHDAASYEQRAAISAARAYLGHGDWQDAEAWAQAAIAAAPDSCAAGNLRALEGPHKLADAEALLRQMTHQWPSAVEAALCLGAMQVQQGHYRAGWADIARAHQRVENVHQAPSPHHKPQHVVPLAAFNLGITPGISGAQLRAPWTGERSLSGKTVLVWGRKLLGCADAILLARYARLLASEGARVVLDCDAALVPLLRTAPGVAEAAADATETVDFHANVLHGMLPSLFGTTLDTIPFPNGYLSADPAGVAKWNAALPEGRKVGLVWAGDLDNAGDLMRSMPFGTLAPILSVPGVQFVSLQVGERAQDAVDTSNVVDASPLLTDFAETAAAIECLDVVITVDTAVANLAGALGRPVWVMLPHLSDYRWGMSGDRSPWYHSARLFRQPTAGDWNSVTRDVAVALGALS